VEWADAALGSRRVLALRHRPSGGPRVYPLKGQHRWVTVPSTWSALIGAAIAVFYAVFTVEILEGTRIAFGGIMLAVVFVANLFGDREEQVRMKTLRALGDGKIAMSRDNLILALTEAARGPDVTFWVNLLFWLVG